VGVPFECSEVGFDSTQTLLLLADGLLDLGLADAKHPSELIDRRVLLENSADLFQREAEVAQGQDAMQSAQLAGGVEAVAVGRVDLLGLEQADLIVVAQHPRRHLAESSELSDVQHDADIYMPSHSVKVKGPATRAVTVARGCRTSRLAGHRGLRIGTAASVARRHH